MLHSVTQASRLSSFLVYLYWSLLSTLKDEGGVKIKINEKIDVGIAKRFSKKYGNKE